MFTAAVSFNAFSESPCRTFVRTTTTSPWPQHAKSSPVDIPQIRCKTTQDHQTLILTPKHVTPPALNKTVFKNAFKTLVTDPSGQLEFNRLVEEVVVRVMTLDNASITHIADELKQNGWEACLVRPRRQSWGTTAPYIVVKRPAPGLVDLIVEPYLREYLTPARATPKCLDLIALFVPGPFVGTLCDLERVLVSASTTVAADFALRGDTLPPWRRFADMLYRWLP